MKMTRLIAVTLLITLAAFPALAQQVGGSEGGGETTEGYMCTWLYDDCTASALASANDQRNQCSERFSWCNGFSYDCRRELGACYQRVDIWYDTKIAECEILYCYTIY